MEKAEIDSHTYDIYLGTWNSEQTITKIENQSLFRISHFLVIFLSFLINILHLQNSVFKRETLVKCYDPYIYMPRHGDVSAHAKERPRGAKKSSIFSQSSGMVLFWEWCLMAPARSHWAPPFHNFFYTFGGAPVQILVLFFPYLEHLGGSQFRYFSFSPYLGWEKFLNNPIFF